MRGHRKIRRFGGGRVEMTPMIDIVFQLLLFFLVASHFNEEARSGNEGELDAVLPEAAEAMPMVAQPKELIVNIQQDGRFVVAGDPYGDEQLSGLLQQRAVNNPGQSVIIRGDERADWKHVAKVMGLCNQAGIRDYRVAVVPAGAAARAEGA